MSNREDLLAVLEEAMTGSAKHLAQKVKDGTVTASDIGQIRALFSEAGGDLRFQSQPTETGDSVLSSLSNVDPSLLQH